MKVIDISQEILTCRVYEGDPAPVVDRLMDMNEGELYNLSAFSMCAHNGTHIDAPRHFIKDGKAVDDMPLDSFVGTCFVVEHKGDVGAADAKNILSRAVENNAGERILLKGDLVVTPEAAEVFAGAKIKLLGNESQTVGPENAPMEVHLMLLSAEVVLLEGIVLSNVDEGVYTLSAAPLNFKGIEGSPCRAILIKQ